MAKKISVRQRRILDFIRNFYQEHGLPPTVRDIQRGCDISSTSVVDYNLHILQREGMVRRRSQVARGIELLEDQMPIGRPEPRRLVPVMGFIAAGAPIPVPGGAGWEAEPIETVEMPAQLGRSKEGLYALRVRGQSMIDALIDDGDIVVVEPLQGLPRNGDTVVALIRSDNEATLKKFYHEGHRVRLQPANSQMQPIYVEPENLEVQGRLVGVIRPFTR